MKKYFNEGLLPDEYVEEGFRRLLGIRKGTIGEAFRKVAREMSVEYQENYYDYIARFFTKNLLFKKLLMGIGLEK